MKNNLLTYIIIFFSTVFTINAQSDTSFSKLGLSDFLSSVKTNHPIAKQAFLVVQSAEANVLKAKGNFDPKLFYEFNNKTFETKNYWTITNGGVYIPTWFGIELKAGIEQNSGVYINPEEIVPQAGLIYTQLTLPISRNLVIDERRAILKEAKIMAEASEFEKQLLLNDIMYKAAKSYWEWVLSYSNLLVFKNAVQVANERLSAVKQASALGDRPNIDTLEASIQVQDRTINYQQSQIDYITKSIQLSNFLWNEDLQPLQINNKTIPLSTNSFYEYESNLFNIISKIDSTIELHPELKKYEFKLNQLNIERKFKKEQLKPLLNANYSPLSNANNYSFYNNNYKWGMNFEFPVFIRKQRGDLKLTQIKIQDIQLEQQYKKIELMNKVNAAVNDYRLSKEQINLFTKTVNDYKILWESEKILFTTGESSLFMVNSREMAYISAQLKLNEIINKNKKAALEAEFAIGQLNKIF